MVVFMRRKISQLLSSISIQNAAMLLKQQKHYTTAVQKLDKAQTEKSQRSFDFFIARTPYYQDTTQWLPILHSLLSQRKFSDAEVLLCTLEKSTENFREVINAKFVQMILNEYLTADIANGEDHCFKWFEKMKEWNIEKDIFSFCIPIYHFQKAGMIRECEKFYARMTSVGFVWKDLVNSLMFTEERLRELQDILKISPDNSTIASDFEGLFTPEPPKHQKPVPVVNLIPEVVPVRSTSNGIGFIKSSMKALEVENDDLLLAQEKLEKDSYLAAYDKFIKETEAFESISKYVPLSGVRSLIPEWVKVATAALNDQLNKPAPILKDTVSNYRAYAVLRGINPKQLALIAILELLRIQNFSSFDNGAVLVALSTFIGKSIEKESFASHLESNPVLRRKVLPYAKVNELFNNNRLLNMSIRKVVGEIEQHNQDIETSFVPKWSTELYVEVGSALIACIIPHLMYKNPATNEKCVAFHHAFRIEKGKKYGIIVMHEAIMQVLTTSKAPVIIEPSFLPMLVPPKLWLTTNSGGYLTQKNYCVRVWENDFHRQLIKQAESKGQLSLILSGLDVLGRTAWSVNEKVLVHIIKAWNEDMQIGDLPPQTLLEKTVYRSEDTFASHEEYVQFVRACKERRDINAKYHSMRCDINYKLEIARKFTGKTLYFPHNLDFRGRAYPIPPYLNHIGADICRALLKFQVSKTLGKEGYYWLKIHLANLYGYDKHPFDDRAKFVDDNMENVIDSATDPFNGKRWWLTAEYPWQCLAVCIEIKEAIDSGNPETFKSQIAVQMDGSCNGLQHYAALGRDLLGASQVNLLPSDRPSDVYSGVAAFVSEEIKKEALNGDAIPKKLDGKITRKIVKLPVMTNVYGVTAYGMRKQVEEMLKDLNVVDKGDFNGCSSYISKKVLYSLDQIFENARKIQSWLAFTAGEISRSVPASIAEKMTPARDPDAEKSANNETEEECEDEEITEIPAPKDLKVKGTSYWCPEGKNKFEGDFYPQTPVVWISPMGLPICQPYKKSEIYSIRTNLQKIAITNNKKNCPVLVKKNISGFPPNFIHSLDATHMMMTAIACYESQIVFASVHDCFWTHPSDVPVMNRILREQFVKLYTSNIMENLRDDFRKRYAGHKVPVVVKQTNAATGKVQIIKTWRDICIPDLPPKGKLDINDVLKSAYFFS